MNCNDFLVDLQPVWAAERIIMSASKPGFCLATLCRFAGKELARISCASSDSSRLVADPGQADVLIRAKMGAMIEGFVP